MQEEKIITAGAAVITPAQLELLYFCRHGAAREIVESIEQTLHLALFSNGEDIPRQSMQHVFEVRQFMKCLEGIIGEGERPQIVYNP